ncbi:MAG: NHL repeat-containing protein [Saprospiraceae bacterium]|nr:NHL repeat-containing protein [Saprospiraceae bacterium]
MKNVLIPLLLLLCMACNSDDEGETPILSSLEITSSQGELLDLAATRTTTLSASGLDQFGQDIALPVGLQWSANNDKVMVTQSGEVTAQAVGTSIVTASVGNVSEDFSIDIIDSTPEKGTFLYVSDAVDFDTGPWNIYRYDENGQNPIVFIDSGLGWPQDILFLEDQNQVLISNLNSGRINRHNANTGTLLGSFATGINGPTRIKIGPDNLLYVLQWSGNGRVLRYQLDGTFVDEFTSVRVTQSIGLDWDANNNLYVSSFDGATVRKFDPNGNDLGLFVTSNLQGPTNIWFDGDGNLIVTDWSGNAVEQFDANGNHVKTLISSGLSQPEGVDFFPNGNFVIGSGGTKEVKLYDSNGSFVQNLVSAGSGGLVRPNAVRIRTID